MRTYNVLYNTTVSYEAVIKAESKDAAKKKVKEVIGEPVTIEKVWELKNDKNPD